MKIFLQTLAVAFGMFSAVPLPQPVWNKQNMRYALCAFPAVGLVSGAGLLGFAALCRALEAGSVLRAAGLCLLPVLVTGGIHLDGFTDTCDALCSYGDREKRLNILKDPHVGAFGVLWLLMLLLVQFGLFAQLYDAPGCAALLGAGYAMARACGGHMIVAQPCAKDSGLARLFSDNADKKIVARVMCVWMLACAAVLAVTGKWFGVLAVGAVLVFFMYHIRKCRKIFGGITGDLCGMCITVCETITLVTAVIGGLCLR